MYKLIALYAANAYGAEREMSASARTRCMVGSSFIHYRTGDEGRRVRPISFTTASLCPAPCRLHHLEYVFLVAFVDVNV